MSWGITWCYQGRMSYNFIFTFHREKHKEYSESVGKRELLWIISLPLCRGSFWEIKCLNVWSCLGHEYWVMFGTIYQNPWYFLICGEGYESGSLSEISIKNSHISFRGGHDFVIPVYLWLQCPYLLFAKTLRSQVSRKCAVCGDRPFWMPSPCCKTHQPWCTAQAFWLKNVTFSKLLGGDDFITFFRNSYNFLPFKYSFISAVLLLKLIFELRPLAELL